MDGNTHLTVQMRSPDLSDGATMWRLARASGGLDLNSAYLYLLACRQFRDSCAIATGAEGRAVGFVLGHRPPAAPDTLFVWQVAVETASRGMGIARSAILWLVRQSPQPVRWIEATVTPSNRSSAALFEGLARELDCDIGTDVWIPSGCFPEPHETEMLVRIGPLFQRRNLI